MNVQRNSQLFGANSNGVKSGFDDNFVPQNANTQPYLNMNAHHQTSQSYAGSSYNQQMLVRTDMNPNNAQNGGNFRHSIVSMNGSEILMTSPKPPSHPQNNPALLHQRSMQTFYQSPPPEPAPRTTQPSGDVTHQAASSLANIMTQSAHGQLSPTSGKQPPIPRIPDRKSPKPTESARLVPSNNMPDLLNSKPGVPGRRQGLASQNQAGNRCSNASSCDDSLVAIPQTESVLPLNQQVWFHGPISRAESEKRLRKDGDFLVREKPANNDVRQFVLSGFQGGSAKHLLLVDPNGRVRTKHNIFESVGHLITHHMKNNIPIISSDSQVKLGNPVKKPSSGRSGMHATEI